MKITKRNEGGVTIFDLEGKLVIGSGDIVLRDAVADALKAGDRQLLVNFAGVKMMDSSGLGELVRARQSAEEAGGKIKLLHVESKVRDLLQMTQLIGVFDTFEDEVDAITSFR